MNTDQLINEYTRLNEEQQGNFDRRYRSLMNFRRRSRALLKEMKQAGFEGSFAVKRNGRKP